MWFITLLLGAVVFFLINYWINSHFNDWKKRGIPYSPSTSPIKMLLNYIFTKKGLFELLQEDYKRTEGHRFAGFFQMFTPGIMIRDPDLIHQICIKDFSHFVDRSLPSEVPDLFAGTIASLTGDEWRNLRHKMTPTFTSGKLKMMFQPIKECCEEVVEFINRKNGQDTDARDFMFKYGINLIGKIAFGLKVDALNEETEKENEFLNISKMFFKPSFMLMVKFTVSLSMPKVRKYIKFRLIDKEIEVFFQKLVKDMISHREKTGEIRNDFLQLMIDHKKKEEATTSSDRNETNPPETHPEDPEDHELLDQLKHLKGGFGDNSLKVFTDECIVSQTFMFVSAGSETMAMALSFILFELADNPLCQKKLQDEVDFIISKNGFNYDDYDDKNMKYMDQIIDETLRIHAGSGFIPRMCTKNYRIPDSDVIIEKGTLLSLPIVCIGMDPQYFPNPEKFDPNRFEDMDSIHPGVFLPFGSGPRMCIAKRLAILEIKMVLTILMQSFTIKLSPKTKMPLKLQKSSVFQHVEGGIWIKFEKR